MFDKTYELELQNGIEWSCEGIRIVSKLSGTNLDITLCPQYPRHTTAIKLMTSFSVSSYDKTLRIQDLMGNGFTNNKRRGYGTLIINTLIQLLQKLIVDKEDWRVSGIVSNGQGEFDDDNAARCAFWKQFGFLINSTNGMSCELNNLKLVNKNVDNKTSSIINLKEFYAVTEAPPLFMRDLKKLKEVNLDVLSCKGEPNDKELEKAQNKEKWAFKLVDTICVVLLFLIVYLLWPKVPTFDALINLLVITVVCYFMFPLCIHWLWYSLSVKVDKPLLIRSQSYFYDKRNEFYQSRKNYINELEGNWGFLWRLEPLSENIDLTNTQKELFSKSKKLSFFEKDYENYAKLMRILSNTLALQSDEKIKRV